MKAVALKSTYLKKEPIQSSVLGRSDIKFVNQGWTCPILNVYDERYNHVQVELGYSAGYWWLYKPHFNITETYKVSDSQNKEIYAQNIAQMIVDVCVENDYPLRRGTNELNLIGIEGFNINGTFNSDKKDLWNDYFFVLEFISGKPQLIYHAKCTTEPGDYYTRNPLNSNGAARLDLGFHKNLWEVGDHRGYKALIQGGNVARLIRDRNKNHLRDDSVSFERYNGINLHTTKTTGWRGSYIENTIGKWSAGCVVIQSPEKFQKLMRIITQTIDVIGNGHALFDFILLDEKLCRNRIKPLYPKKFDTFDNDDVDILARTIYGEARGETTKGKIAVGWVVRNRAERSPKYNFSDNITEVCLQKYQFSCWNYSDINKNKLFNIKLTDPHYIECKDIAEKVLNGHLPDPSNGADHYYADYISPPNWVEKDKLVAQIGTHLFFKLL